MGFSIPLADARDSSPELWRKARDAKILADDKITETLARSLGGVPERLIGLVLKTSVALVVTEGSNPSPTVFSYYSDLILKQTFLTNVATTIRQDMGYFHALGHEGYVDCGCHPERSMAMAWNLFALGVFSWNVRADERSAMQRFVVGIFGPGHDSAVRWVIRS